MSSNKRFKPPKKIPINPGHLARLVDLYSEDEQLESIRTRRWISCLALISVLDQVRDIKSEPLFLVKGGVAMELCFGADARATQDFDAVFLNEVEDLTDTLDKAFSKSSGDFSFQPLGKPKLIPNTKSYQLEIKITFANRGWQTIKMDIATPEGSAMESDQVGSALNIQDFKLFGSNKIPCLSVRYHIAEKLHAVTLTYNGKENPRYWDLIDLLLLRDLVSDLSSVREACDDVFKVREKHSWPPELRVPSFWLEPYAELANELKLKIVDVEEAAAEIRTLIAEIEDTRQ